MDDWLAIARRIEALEDIELDPALVRAMRERANRARPIRFFTPSFKAYSSPEISACGRSLWPAISVTGAECALQCDHCRARILEPLIPARTPEALWRIVNEQIAAGAKGMLLTGGSNLRDEVEYGPFYPVLRRVKDAYPDFRIAIHTALVDERIARAMERAGVDCAMMDVIGAQDTVAQVYHLRRPVSDFERSLGCLKATSMKVVPHIVIGLHYGRLLGEWNALEIVRRHLPDALVLVVVMPFFAPAHRPFATPDARAVGRFFLEARAALPELPLLLGCARPAGADKAKIDAYAVMAGLDGIAHPAEGAVELALRLGREAQVRAACCSMGVGEAVLGGGEPQLALDAERFLERERARRAAARGLAGIRVVVQGA
jgi:uncharacterized radical SAM superfamily protein